MAKTIIYVICVLCVSGWFNFLPAQYAPQAYLMGTTAIHKDDLSIQSWGDSCLVIRGWMDIADTTLGKVTAGFNQDALGKADGMIVSLGDAGEIIYYFQQPIQDEPGPDFAIFENGFLHPTDTNWAYLELATVSVSNDGIHYVQFPAHSLTDTTQQIAGTGTYADCRLFDGLAGKYIAQFGTPFDLIDLAIYSSLQLDKIRYVKIKDVVGTLQRPFCTYDQMQRPINDPYPTPFPTGGFDIDGIAVMHQSNAMSTHVVNTSVKCTLYPNPTLSELMIQSDKPVQRIEVMNVMGQCLIFNSSTSKIDLNALPAGIYVIRVIFNEGEEYHQSIQKI